MDAVSADIERRYIELQVRHENLKEGYNDILQERDALLIEISALKRHLLTLREHIGSKKG